MFIYESFPNIESQISSKYKLILADANTTAQQKKYSYLIMLFVYYPLCFGLGYSMFSFHTLFIHSAFWFLGYLIITSFFVIPLHYFLQCLFYTVKINSDECFIGFNKNLLVPFCYCRKALKKVRLLTAALVPYILLTIIPLVIFINSDTNLFLYSIACGNALLSSFDIYDAYILIKKIPKGDSFIIKSNNIFYTVSENIKTG